ncbi:MAG: PilN domain-containing protein [Syntrophomonas sp.]
MEPAKPIYINLLVREQQPGRRFPTSAVIPLLLVALTIGIWCWHGYQQKELRALRALNSELKAELGQYKGERPELQSLQNLRSQIEDKQERVDQVRQAQIRCTEVYAEIEHVLPNGLVLTGIEINEEKVLISGYALDYQEMAAFISGLRKSRLLQNVILISSNIDEDGGEVYFQVEMGWEAGKK